MALDFDVLVVGTGPAGEKAAMQASKLGKRVGIVDRRWSVGGNCLHRGTIPSKTLRETITFLATSKKGRIEGFKSSFSKDTTLAAMMQSKDDVIRGQRAVVEDRFERNDVTLLNGTAHFLDAHRMAVEDPEGGTTEVTANVILLAVGSRPARDPSIPFDEEHVFDSDTVLGIRRIPHSMTVVGGGIIGCEYACMFSALGTKVTLMDSRPWVLDFADREIAELLVARMRDDGITLRLGEQVERITLEGPRRVVATTVSGKQMAAETLLYAVGRDGNTFDLKLERAGLKAAKRGLLEVNGQFQTAVPHIYAAGDVIGFPSLASTSMLQGRMAMQHAFGLSVGGEGTYLPFGVYTIPEISMVGETEQELTKNSVPYEMGHAFFREIARGEILGDRSGMLKLLFERETHRLRGVHVIGTNASDLVHIGQAVLSFGGPVDYFVETVFNYPTLSEAYRVAALNGLNRL